MYKVININSLETVFEGKTYKRIAEYLGVNEHVVKAKYAQSLCVGDLCIVKNDKDLTQVLINAIKTRK